MNFWACAPTQLNLLPLTPATVNYQSLFDLISFEFQALNVIRATIE